MAGWTDVRDIALGLPEAREHESRGRSAWRVRQRGFVWDRPLGKGDRASFAPSPPPEGEILGARIADISMRDAILARDPAVFFTIPHFSGFPAILLLLERIDRGELEDVITDAWLAVAPDTLVRAFRSAS